MTVRCKFHCQSITKTESSFYDSMAKQTVTKVVISADFNPVYGGNKENEQFFASTPSGSIKIGTVREDVFEPGKDYYVDFTPAE